MKQEWHPIVSAPKDGSRFLVHKFCHGTQELAIAWFDARHPETWEVMDLPNLTMHRAPLYGVPDCVSVSWMPYPQPDGMLDTRQ